jgi:hypothetical protein
MSSTCSCWLEGLPNGTHGMSMNMSGARRPRLRRSCYGGDISSSAAAVMGATGTCKQRSKRGMQHEQQWWFLPPERCRPHVRESMQ